MENGRWVKVLRFVLLHIPKSVLTAWLAPKRSTDRIIPDGTEKSRATAAGAQKRVDRLGSSQAANAA